MKIKKIASVGLLSVVASGSIIAAVATPASALSFANVAVTPNSNLVQGDTVTVKASGFPAADAGMPMYTFECAQQALSTQDSSYCDLNVADDNNTGVFDSTLTGGKATGTVTFTVLTGSNFKPVNTAGKCQYDSNPTAQSNLCYVTVSDTATQETNTTVGLGGNITFKNPNASTAAKTKTAIKAPKSAKAGKSIKLKISTTGGSKYTGTVTVTDNGKKVAKAKEAKSGKVTVTEKKAKKGTHKFVAKYSGDSANKASSGKATVKVKK